MHITQARDTRGTYITTGAGTTDTKDVIGWDNNTIQGCDIIVPVLSFTIPWGIAIEAATFAYAKLLASLVGKVNSAAMFDSQFDPGEVLLIGCQGQLNRPMERYDLVGTFLTSPNVTGLALGPITGIAKLGFDYLDVTYKADQRVRNTEPGVVPKPTEVSVRVVYEEADLNTTFTPP